MKSKSGMSMDVPLFGYAILQGLMAVTDLKWWWKPETFSPILSNPLTWS